MRLEPLLLPLYKSNLLKCYFLVIIILLENDSFNCSDKAHFYFTYDLNPMIFRSCYLGDGNTFKKNISKNHTIIKMVNLQNIFIHHCFYCLHIFQLEKMYKMGSFHFYLKSISFYTIRANFYFTKKQDNNFPLYSPLFLFIFSSLSFQSNPPTQKKLLQLKFLRKFFYKKHSWKLLQKNFTLLLTLFLALH